MALPGLPAPAVPSLPPGLTRAATTTDSSSSSDIDYLETQTAVLHISEESTVHDVAIEGLDCLHDLDTAHAYQPTIPLDGIVDSLWDDPPPKSQANIVICDEHAVVCSKGVCTVYSAQIRAIERQNGTAKRGRGRGGGGGAPPNRGRNGGKLDAFAFMASTLISFQLVRMSRLSCLGRTLPLLLVGEEAQGKRQRVEPTRAKRIPMGSKLLQGKPRVTAVRWIGVMVGPARPPPGATSQRVAMQEVGAKHPSL